MIWSTGEGNGFTTGESWLPFAKAANRYSVENQELEDDSMLHFYRKLLGLRNKDSVLRLGLCSFIDITCIHILAYCRELDEDQRLILLNMSGKIQTFGIPLLQDKDIRCEKLFSTHMVQEPEMDSLHAITMQPYQGSIYRLVSKQ